MICVEELKALMIENETLKKDISEIEILHKVEIDRLKAKIRELEKAASKE